MSFSQIYNGTQEGKDSTRPKCERKKKVHCSWGVQHFNVDFGRQVRESIIITEAERSNLLPKVKDTLNCDG